MLYKRMLDSDYNYVTKRALERGYRMMIDGRVIGLRGRTLKPQLDRWGRSRISVRVTPSAPPHTVLVHRLAALQWFGDGAFCPGVHVRHLDNDATNNSRRNLALGSPHENAMDKTLSSRMSTARLAAAPLRKLSPTGQRQLLDDRERGMTYRDICQKYGLAKSTVSYIVRGLTYSNTEAPVVRSAGVRTKHGKITMYQNGCRCSECLSAKNASQKKHRATKK